MQLCACQTHMRWFLGSAQWDGIQLNMLAVSAEVFVLDVEYYVRQGFRLIATNLSRWETSLSYKIDGRF